MYRREREFGANMHKAGNSEQKNAAIPLKSEKDTEGYVRFNEYLRAVRTLPPKGVSLRRTTIRSMVEIKSLNDTKERLDMLLRALTHVNADKRADFEKHMRNLNEKTKADSPLTENDMLMITTQPLGLVALLFYAVFNGDIDISEASFILHQHNTYSAIKESSKDLATELLTGAVNSGFVVKQDPNGPYIPTVKCEFLVSHWYYSRSAFPLWLYDEPMMRRSD